MARYSHSTESVTKRYSLSNSSSEDRLKRNVLRPGVFRNTGRRKSPIPAGEKEGGELVQPRRAGKNAAQTAISGARMTPARETCVRIFSPSPQRPSFLTVSRFAPHAAQTNPNSVMMKHRAMLPVSFSKLISSPHF